MRLEDKPLFDTFFHTCQPRLSDYTFANTFIWREPINLRWRLIRDCLCVFANGDGGLTLLFPPLGQSDPAAAAREALAICRQYAADHRLDVEPRIEYASDDLLGRLGPAFSAVPMSGDYVYSTRRMIDLAGGDLASKRQARNRFARCYQPRTEPFGPQHIEPCAALMNRWRQQCDAIAVPEVGVCVKRCKDVLATYEAMCHAEVLGLRGMVLYGGESIVGFTLGEFLDGDTCSILIEKTDREYVGSAQYIFSEFCRQYWAETQWCNVGDDWDIPSLAWTKQSYRPSHRLGKWVVRQEAAVVVAAGASATPAAEPAAPVAAATGRDEAGRYELGSAQLDDLDRLFSLDAQCFAKEIAFSRRQWRNLLRSRNASTHVVRLAGEIVADALLLRRRVRGRVVGRLYSLAVSAPHRGKGFGKELLRNCLDVAKAEGISAVFLEVEASNAAAIGLYESFGFVHLRRLPDYYGSGKDGCKMVLRLAPAAPAVAVATEAVPAAAVPCLAATSSGRDAM
ncbi:MAG TPA: GNAT family N-acetyltransferase [Phycisphaerae bacterium]|nr:GNAT family N-acetyltransferase [Phycisphaerae bacterium]